MDQNPYSAPQKDPPNVANGEPHARLTSLTRSIAVIATWQLASAIAMSALGYPVGWVVHSIYTGLFGDIQNSYASYERASTYSVMIVVTALATALGVALLMILERRRYTRRVVA
jgi:hypothetical protein